MSCGQQVALQPAGQMPAALQYEGNLGPLRCPLHQPKMALAGCDERLLADLPVDGVECTTVWVRLCESAPIMTM